MEFLSDEWDKENLRSSVQEGTPIQKLFQRTKSTDKKTSPLNSNSSNDLTDSPQLTTTQSPTVIKTRPKAENLTQTPLKIQSFQLATPIRKSTLRILPDLNFKDQEPSETPMNFQLIRCQNCQEIDQVNKKWEKYTDQLKDQIVNAMEDLSQYESEYRKIKEDGIKLCTKYDEVCRKLRDASVEYNSLCDLYDVQVRNTNFLSLFLEDLKKITLNKINSFFKNRSKKNIY